MVSFGIKKNTKHFFLLILIRCSFASMCSLRSLFSSFFFIVFIFVIRFSFLFLLAHSHVCAYLFYSLYMLPYRFIEYIERELDINLVCEQKIETCLYAFVNSILFCFFFFSFAHSVVFKSMHIVHHCFLICDVRLFAVVIVFFLVTIP